MRAKGSEQHPQVRVIHLQIWRRGLRMKHVQHVIHGRIAHGPKAQAPVGKVPLWPRLLAHRDHLFVAGGLLDAVIEHPHGGLGASQHLHVAPRAVEQQAGNVVVGIVAAR